jgi:hypothetical protein
MQAVVRGQQIRTSLERRTTCASAEIDPRDLDLSVHVAGRAGSVSSGSAVDEQRMMLARLPKVNEHMQRVHARCGRSDVHVRIVIEHRQRQRHRSLSAGPGMLGVMLEHPTSDDESLNVAGEHDSECR